MVETLGKYKIDGFVAEGGMARILRAKTEGVGGVEKTVALKCLKGSMQEDDNFVQMLLDEARITVRMTHKNICQVYGLEHDADQYFMVMEYIDGISLADLTQYLFSKNRVFPIESAVFIAMEVCNGLSYAHRLADETGESLGIVHRDVNPQNICISKEGEVKLIDFGIAKSHNLSSETQIGTIKGKFNYMSPEQARGDRVDQRTDVFALGAVLYEMLCGHMLYPLSLDDAKLRMKTKMADFVPIESYLPDIPDTLRKILAKALTRDINQRFATSRDFLMALTQFFHDSCKLYDSLELSTLVSKYLKHQGQSKTDSHPSDKAVVRPSSGNLNKVSRIAEKASEQSVAATFEDSSDTAVITAAEAKKLASSNASLDEESATTVYSKADFDAAVNAELNSSNPENVKLAQACKAATEPEPASSINGTLSSLNRCVDLEVKDMGKGSTVMVKLEEVQVFSKLPAPIASFINKVISKVISVDEKTLFITAVALGVVLVLSLILFFAIRSSDDSDEDAQALMEQAEVSSIMVASIPSGAEIYYGDVFSGEKTPFRISLPQKAPIILKYPYYDPYTLSSDELSKDNLIATMIPAKIRLKLTSKPNGATVVLNGKESGVTPLSTKVPMNQPCTIELSKSGYETSHREVKWDEDASVDQEILIKLTKKK